MIVQIYRPNKSQDADGSVYFQQQASGQMDDPLKTFDADLIQLIDKHTELGYQCIIMGDFNIPLNGKSNLERQLQERGIRDVVQERYGAVNAPNTHKRGSNPIDGIFASESIEMVKGGYDGGQDSISDHRLIWADITLDSILGVVQQAEDNGKERKLKELRAIKEREHTKDVHQRIKYAQGKLRGGGVRYIHKEDDEGNVETVKDKLRMEHEIMRANEGKLQMANESPIRQGEMSRTITDHDYEQWEKFLAGQVTLPEPMEEGTRRWLDKFKGIHIDEEDTTITMDAYTQSWKHKFFNSSAHGTTA